MSFLFRKFQEVASTLAKSPKFTRDPRHLQFEADINRLFLYTSFNRLGRNADEKDAEEIIEMASKASVADQQRQVQENIHYQIKNMCTQMNDILQLDPNSISDTPNLDLSPQKGGPKRSGLSFAIGSSVSSPPKPVVTQTKLLSRIDLSSNLKDRIGYTLDAKPSQIPHEEAGMGLFLSGECNVGSVVAFYPGIIHSPAYYRYIPGYPRVDSCNSYLITRYDDIIINAQPWGVGGESREIWDGFNQPQMNPDSFSNISRTDRLWKVLSSPVRSSGGTNSIEVLELRNPLAFGHFANHPAKGIDPNVMVCPYDFPVTEKDMRVYIPNIVFGGEEVVAMKRFGSFWFRSKRAGDQVMDVPVMKTLVLVAMRPLCEEEVYLNYRLSNSKRRPSWYIPVDEEEDRRRWS